MLMHSDYEFSMYVKCNDWIHNTHYIKYIHDIVILIAYNNIIFKYREKDGYYALAYRHRVFRIIEIMDDFEK